MKLSSQSINNNKSSRWCLLCLFFLRTSLNKLCKNSEPKPFCWAKPICFDQPQQTMQKFWAKTILLSQTDYVLTSLNKLCQNSEPKPFCWAKPICFDQPQQTMPKFWAKTILLSQTDYVLTSLNKLCQNSEPKPFCWAKPIMFWLLHPQSKSGSCFQSVPVWLTNPGRQLNCMGFKAQVRISCNWIFFFFFFLYTMAAKYY
jgi:hypothetical protein